MPLPPAPTRPEPVALPRTSCAARQPPLARRPPHAAASSKQKSTVRTTPAPDRTPPLSARSAPARLPASATSPTPACFFLVASCTNLATHTHPCARCAWRTAHEGLKPYGFEARQEASFYRDSDEPIRQASMDYVANFPLMSTFELFHPHITLGIGRPESSQKPFTFIASHVAICQLGNFNTSVEYCLSTAWTSKTCSEARRAKTHPSRPDQCRPDSLTYGRKHMPIKRLEESVSGRPARLE